MWQFDQFSNIRTQKFLHSAVYKYDKFHCTIQGKKQLQVQTHTASINTYVAQVSLLCAMGQVRCTLIGVGEQFITFLK